MTAPLGAALHALARAHRTRLAALLAPHGIHPGQDLLLRDESMLPGGVRALFARVSEIDARLKQGLPPDAELLDTAQALLSGVLADIESLADDAPPPSSGAAPSPAALRDLVERLKTALRSDLGAVEALLDELGRCAAGTSLQPAVQDIAGRIDRFELDAALALLAALPIEPEAAP